VAGEAVILSSCSRERVCGSSSSDERLVHLYFDREVANEDLVTGLEVVGRLDALAVMYVPLVLLLSMMTKASPF